MANRAHSIGGVASMIYGEPRVIKRCSRPRCGVVARSASRREYCRRRLVHGVRGGVVIRFMAPIAVRGQRRVIVVHMAHGTGHEGRRVSVEAGQWEYGRVVIEFTICPRDHVMA